MSDESTEPRKDADQVQPVSRGTVVARIVVMAVVGAVAAVLAQFAIGRMTDVFHLPPELVGLGGGQVPGAEDQARIAAGRLVLFYKHSALWLGSAGALLGISFGLALGLFRRSAGSLWRGTVFGALLGGLFGTAAGPMAICIERWLHSRLARNQSNVPDHQLILMHAATWLVIGAGIGIGVGIGASARRARAAVTSMAVAAIAGVVGGTLYLLLAGIVLPLADTTEPLPTGATEWLLWLALPSVFIGLALGRKG